MRPNFTLLVLAVVITAPSLAGCHPVRPKVLHCYGWIVIITATKAWRWNVFEKRLWMRITTSTTAGRVITWQNEIYGLLFSSLNHLSFIIAPLRVKVDKILSKSCDKETLSRWWTLKWKRSGNCKQGCGPWAAATPFCCAVVSQKIPGFSLYAITATTIRS